MLAIREPYMCAGTHTYMRSVSAVGRCWLCAYSSEYHVEGHGYVKDERVVVEHADHEIECHHQRILPGDKF